MLNFKADASRKITWVYFCFAAQFLLCTEALSAVSTNEIVNPKLVRPSEVVSRKTASAFASYESSGFLAPQKSPSSLYGMGNFSLGGDFEFHGTDLRAKATGEAGFILGENEKTPWL